MAEQGTASIDIDASVEEVFAIVADVAAYPEWIPQMESVEVHGEDEEGVPTSTTQTVDVGIRTITYTLTYEADPPNRMAWVSEPGGDVKLIEGSYTFEVNDEGGTNVTYDLTIDPGFPVPGFMVRKAAQQIVRTALGGLKERAESA